MASHSLSKISRTLQHLARRNRLASCIKCSPTLSIQCLHTQNVLFALKKVKVVKPIVFTGRQHHERICQIYRGMTFEEFAKNSNRSIDQVYEAYLRAKKSNSLKKSKFAKSASSDLQTLQIMSKILGFSPETVRKEDTVQEQNCDILSQRPADPKDLVKRPPVVTIMGHVDHGKTSILDNLRKSKIVDKEFGGITQHIGAFQVKLPTKETITFLDTPGHAAFSAMRQRGARVTDIVILVVAADDGVMDQTVESIKYAKNAGVPIIVAINKIDKPTTDPELVKQMLLEYEVACEGHGGDVQAVAVSALKGTNMPDLLEAINTQAEIMELRSDPKGKVEGRIIESKIDPGKGRITTVLVQRGTLRRGTLVIAGTCWTKVRAMFDENGKSINEAAPSTPVVISGWKDLPSAGEQLLEGPSERALYDAMDYRITQKNEEKQLEDMIVIDEKRQLHQNVYNEKRSARLAMGYRRNNRNKEQLQKDMLDTDTGLTIIVKGDVDGSLEAILNILSTYQSTKCPLNLAHYAVGNVTINDVEVAAMFGGVIYAFNVDVPVDIQKNAESRGVQIKSHNVIYKLFDELCEDLLARIPTTVKEEVVGEAVVQKLFTIKENKRKIQVAGCSCVDGKLKKDLLYKVYREDVIVYTGSLFSLKHLKKEVKFIDSGMECGLSLENTDFEFKEGDRLVCIETETIPPELDWNTGF